MAARTTTDKPDTQEMVIVHRVFRREFGLAPAMVAKVPDGDVAQAAPVAAHLVELGTMLHHHHSGEDDLVWPRLHARASVPGDLLERMEAQHATVSALLDRVEALVPRWAERADGGLRDELVGVLQQVSTSLDEHLAEEEREVLPLIEQHLTAAEWGELGERGMAAMPKSRTLVLLGHILEEASPEERARFLTLLPPPARVLYRLVGRRKYLREVSVLRAGISVPQQRQG